MVGRLRRGPESSGLSEAAMKPEEEAPAEDEPETWLVKAAQASSGPVDEKCDPDRFGQ